MNDIRISLDFHPPQHCYGGRVGILDSDFTHVI
jgi:hypothetical protein